MIHVHDLQHLWKWNLEFDAVLQKIYHAAPLLPKWFNFNPSMDKYNNVWDESTYPFLNFNGATVEV